MTTGRGAGTDHHLSGVPKEARPYQGRPAGVVTRLMASAVDLATVLAIVAVGLLLINVAALAIRPLAFEPVAVPLPAILITGLMVSVVYLTMTWASTGRTLGAAVLGLRVVDAGTHARLPAAKALVRAGVCTFFPVGLLWALVTPDRRSLHDRLTGSVVVYHWLPSS